MMVEEMAVRLSVSDDHPEKTEPVVTEEASITDLPAEPGPTPEPDEGFLPMHPLGRDDE